MPSAALLLDWYDRHRRRMPWRAEPGQVADPYRVWLSEIMLQQTTVTVVIPYFERFVSRYPTVFALAAAPLEDVLSAWAGLGYYARARNLHACARAVATAGGFPHDPEALRALPGIGVYTAAAIGAIAFNIPTVPIDGNVERVTARLFAIDTPLPAARPAIRAAVDRLGADLAARARPSDFAQALFDLGAMVCTPTQPVCGLCPWMAGCAARVAGNAAALPRKAPKRSRPLRHGVHFWLSDDLGQVLLRRRPPTGLLGGMMELPGTPWRDQAWTLAEALGHAPLAAAWRPVGQVRHGFTHFELSIDLLAARVGRITADGLIRPIALLVEEALPSVMRKCARAAMDGRSVAG
jgi:A/G-specific adenine glycosylase